ncbi:MAG: methyl-accepting chemotaxis protein [Asticcacaulis sp.]
MTITQKVFAPVALLAMALIMLALAAQWVISDLSGASSRLIHEQSQLQRALEIRSVSRSLQRDTINYIFETKPKERNKIVEKLAERSKKLKAHGQWLVENTRPYQGAKFVEFVRQNDLVLEQINHVIRYSDQVTDPMAAYAEFGQTVRPAERKASKIVDQVIKTAEEQIKKAQDSQSRETQKKSVALISISVLVVLVCCGASILIVQQGVAKPLNQNAKIVLELARGNLDVSIPVNRRDELGELARNLNQFRTNMLEAQQAARAEGAARAQETEARTHRLDALLQRFDADCAAVVAAVDRSAAELGRTAESVRHLAQQAAETSGQITETSGNLSLTVEDIAVATDHLNQAVVEISQQVQTADQISAAATGRAEQSAVLVGGLDEKIRDISSVVSLIQDIAAQTNLLALNATIEAARAGEAGKGFAVVAGEVKGLADGTAKATTTITGQIYAIQGEATGAVESLDAIRATIETIRSSNATVTASVMRQTAATQQIASNVRSAAERSRQVSEALLALRQAAEEAEVMASTVQSSATSLTERSQTLRNQVGAFLRDIKVA